MDVRIRHQRDTLTGLFIGEVDRRRMYASVINKIL